MNFFKLYMGDYQRDTGALSIAEHGAYFLMLQYHYATEKPLPTGKDLYRLLRCETKADRNAVDLVAQKFWQNTPEGLKNLRAAKEIAKASEQAETNSRIAKSREEKKKALRGVHEACSEREPNQTPDTITIKTKRKSKAIARTAAAPSLDFGEGPVVETIPLLGDKAAVVRQTYAAELDRLFPAVDVPQTLREIRAWNLTNPTRRKTPRGIEKHISQWCQRVQNGGR